jgi:outer membrane lipoprotein-sorting protein
VRSILKTRFLVLLALVAPLQGRAHGADLQDVQREMEINLGKIKTLVCEVDVVSSMPMGSLQHRFKLYYKNPHKIKSVSLVNPQVVFIADKDTGYYKGERPKKMDENLVEIIKADKKGLIFNTLSFLEGDIKHAVASCGKKICIDFSGSMPKALSDSLPMRSAIKEFSGTIDYSPDQKVVDGFTFMAGAANSSTAIKYQRIKGLSLPLEMRMSMQSMTTTIRFEKIVLNEALSDREFR